MVGMSGPPPPAPPVCQQCNVVIGSRYWMQGSSLLCDACGAAAKAKGTRKLEGPIDNTRSSVGRGGSEGI